MSWLARRQQKGLLATAARGDNKLAGITSSAPAERTAMFTSIANSPCRLFKAIDGLGKFYD